MAVLDIRITEDNLPYVRIEENGNVSERYLTPQQLFQALGQYAKEHAVISTPALPKGCVHYKETTHGQRVVIEFDAIVSNVQFHQAVIQDVHFPRLLFAFTVNGDSVGRCDIIAVKDREIKDSTQLYMYPYSNVLNTRACWSELPIKIQSLTELSRIPYRWFGSENTSCYYGSNNLSGLGYREYMEANSKSARDSFDYDTLSPLGKTFGEWVNAEQSLNE